MSSEFLPEKEKAQEEVEKYYNLMYAKGYFRDSYNSTSLFWILGLSWWQDVGSFTKDGKLPIEKCKEILKKVKESKIPSSKKLKDHLQANYTTIDDGENSPEKWRKYFIEKKKRLIKFMQKSIDLNEPLNCSV
jgi:hypothetical protein